MPLYDCVCRACGKEEEQILKRDEEPEDCECGGEQDRKTIQTPNFALKGGGWGKDGYASNGQGLKYAAKKKAMKK